MPQKRIIFFLLASLTAGLPAFAADPPVTDEQVEKSIRKGIDYLLSNQTPGVNPALEGTWESGTQFIANRPQYGGETCLCLYALLHVNESTDDPRITPRAKELAKAIKFVTDLKPESTYVASLQASALSLLPKDDKIKAVLKNDRDYLLNSTLARGGHTYSPQWAVQNGGIYDNSNSNYALMGLAAIADADLPTAPVPASFWQNYDTFWRRQQNADGGWGYSPNDRPQSSTPMTAAGAASLLLLREYLQTDVTAAPKQDKNLDAALTVLKKQYDPTSENLYYAYSLERIGLAGGYKYFNGSNWYQQTAAMAIKKQEPDGSWALNPQDTFRINNVPATVFTSYALLFLARGRSPVLFNKLAYDGPWDARPRDDANVSAFVARAFEKPLAWQSVSLKPGEDWLDAPVLLITGSKDPKFTDADIAMLKAYVEAGGMIFSSADNGSAAFTDAMKKTAAKIAPDATPPLAMRDLEPTDPLFNLWAKMDKPPKLQALSNGVREIWVHSSVDLGAVWERNVYKQTKAPFELAGNLYFYVTGKGALGHRLDTLTVTPLSDPTIRTIHLARVKYNGNWDPEPGAWPRFAKIANGPAGSHYGSIAGFHTTLSIDNIPAPQLDPTKTPIAHLTGADTFTLNEEYRTGLSTFLAKGGVLFIDNCGGNKPFADSAKTLIPQLIPNAKLEPIPPTDPLFNGDLPDTTKITAVDWRKFTRTRDNANPDNHPHLQGVKKDNHWIVIFSPDDITSGLLGTNTWGIAGYTPRSAQELSRNILLTATNGR